MTIRIFAFAVLFSFFLPEKSSSQNIHRIAFDSTDNIEGYYLAVTPESKTIKGTLVLLTSFLSPEKLLTETKLHNVAYTNDLLTVVVPMKQKLYADSFAINRLNVVIKNLQKRYTMDVSKFVLAGYGEAGNIALRYTELSYQHPSQYPLQPSVVFGIDTPVDLFGLWYWSEQQIKKNFWPGAVGDAKYYLETMTKENGSIYQNRNRYKTLTPFFREDRDAVGNEQYLKNVTVRLYYDSDIEWQLKNRRNSLYDTKLPDGSELINRLLLLGNDKAEFVSSKKEGLRNNGIRHPSTISIVDEVECIHWIKKNLNIFDANTWSPPYVLSIPKGWEVERFSLPADFASSMTFTGVEDIRFASGWGNSKKEDYWSYMFLWWLDGTPKIDAESLQVNLNVYYSGLVNRNIIERKIPENKIVPTKATIKKIKTFRGDLQTFSGSIQMLDYMTQNPMVLNTLVHVKECSLKNKTAVIIELSPKPYDHAIWRQFNNIDERFSCNR